MTTLHERASILRALRAYLNSSQADVAAGSGIGRRSVWQAEAGEACSDKTWRAMLAYYATFGLTVDQDSDIHIAIRTRENELTLKDRLGRLREQIDGLRAALDD